MPSWNTVNSLFGVVEQFGSDAKFKAKFVQFRALLYLAMHDSDVVLLLQLHKHLAHLSHVNVREGVYNKFCVGLRGEILAHVLVGEPFGIHDVHVLVPSIDLPIGHITLLAIPRPLLPKGGVLEVVRKGFVGSSDEHLVSLVHPHLAQSLHELRAKSKPLKVWEDDQTVDCLAKVQRAIWICAYCAEPNICVIPLQNPTLCSNEKVVAQIVMRSKYLPDLSLPLRLVNSLEGEVDAFPRQNPRRSYTFSVFKSMRMSGLSLGMMS